MARYLFIMSLALAAALATLLLLAGCRTPWIQTGGSVSQYVAGGGTTNAAAYATAAAAGANAIQTRDHSEVNAKGTAQFTWSKSIAVWILIGALIVAAIWFVKTFVLSGARIALMK